MRIAYFSTVVRKNFGRVSASADAPVLSFCKRCVSLKQACRKLLRPHCAQAGVVVPIRSYNLHIGRQIMAITSGTADVHKPGPRGGGITAEERKVIFASSLGTIFELYDFYLYGSLAPIIAKQFFVGEP